jgi:hypothetical protein
MSQLHDKLHTALKLWLKLTRFKKKGRTIGDWQVRMTVEELNESLELDDTGITAAMVLRAMLEEAKGANEFTLKDVYHRDAEFMRAIRYTHKLHKILDEPEIAEPVADFGTVLRDAIQHYNGNEKAYALAADPAYIGLIRRDALRSMKDLQRYQFLRAPSRTPKAGYNQWVLQFLNVNSLIEAVAQQPEYGVSLCIIRDEDPVFSYFVFACWNGGTLTLLTDKPRFSHPGQKRMTRRPERQLAGRWEQNHFPYELLDAEWDGKDIYIPKQDGLVHFETQAARLKQLHELEPDVFLWTIMMFGRIEDEHFAKNLQLEHQSYTAEMVQEVVPTGSALVVREGYQHVLLPAVTHADITAEALAPQWEDRATGVNHALERDFGPKVPSELLNLLRDDRGKLLLTDMSRPAQSLARLCEKSKEHRELMAAIPTEFGTPEELRAAQLWSARHNQAVIVGKMVKEDYDRQHKKMCKWFGNACRDNEAAVLEAASHLTWIVDSLLPREKDDTFTMRNMQTGLVPRQHDVLRVEYSDHGRFHGGGFWLWSDYIKMMSMSDGWDVNHKRRYGCYVNGAVATLRFDIRPLNPQDVAAITGVPLDDLPQPIRDYYQTYEPYGGNCILDKLDPMDWVFDNPWAKLPLNLRLFLSKSAFQQLRKNHGLTPLTKAEFDNLRDHRDPKSPKYVKPSRW